MTPEQAHEIALKAAEAWAYHLEKQENVSGEDFGRNWLDAYNMVYSGMVEKPKVELRPIPDWFDKGEKQTAPELVGQTVIMESDTQHGKMTAEFPLMESPQVDEDDNFTNDEIHGYLSKLWDSAQLENIRETPSWTKNPTLNGVYFVKGKSRRIMEFVFITHSVVFYFGKEGYKPLEEDKKSARYYYGPLTDPKDGPPFESEIA